MMFGFGKKREKAPFDKTGKVPVIRASICTGEQVAGFKDVKTKKFQEVMLIRGEKDLKAFLREYDVEESQLQYEW